MTENANLLEAIGGAAALDEIVEAFYARLVADPDLGPLFADTLAERDLPRATLDRVSDRLALYVDDVVGQYGDAG